MRYEILLIFIFLFHSAAFAQQQDSVLRQVDSVSLRQSITLNDSLRSADSLQRVDSTRIADSLNRAIAIARRDSINRSVDSMNAELAYARRIQVQQVLGSHRFFKFYNQPLKLSEHRRQANREEGLFYFLVTVLFFYAVVRIIFYKYISNLVSLFFRITMRQQQVKEQLLQTPLASLLMNILFVIVAGAYMTFLAKYYQFNSGLNFWLLMFYSILFVALLYLGKFIFLKLIGWLFGVSQATDMYIFIVFWVNKMLGILLLPFLVVLAFPYPDFHAVAITLSIILVIFLFLYRFFISYRPVRNEIKINKFHFFLYLCAFEITPLILIYKVLLNFVEQGT